MSAKIQIIKINNREYYLSDDLFQKALLYTKGCRNARELIKKKKIDDDNFIYASNKGTKWAETDGSSRKLDKILFECDWVNKNVTEFNGENNNVDGEYPMAPNKINLSEEEMFQDDEGNKINITVRGEREHDKCYFRVKDIMEGFEMKNLYTTITDDRRDGYKENIHYVFFNCKKIGKAKKTIKKELYLTYTGLLRVLFASHSNKADKFVNWAAKTLFTHQFGTVEAKQELSSKLLGVHAKTVKEVFSTSATNVPCVYLFTLGSAKDLRKSMSLDDKYTDEMIICKYGMTDSIERRAGEHNKTYGSIKGVNLCLKYYAYIDQQYISKAEVDIKEYFEAINCKLDYDNHKELIILDSVKMNKLVKQQYCNLSNMYAGHIKDLIKKIEDLENKLILKDEMQKVQEEKHKNELIMAQQKIQEEKHVNELLIEKHKNEIQKYEIELLKKELAKPHDTSSVLSKKKKTSK